VQLDYCSGGKGWGIVRLNTTHRLRPPDDSPALDRPIARGGSIRAHGSTAPARGQPAGFLEFFWSRGNCYIHDASSVIHLPVRSQSHVGYKPGPENRKKSKFFLECRPL